jgi:hypothetical protein
VPHTRVIGTYGTFVESRLPADAGCPGGPAGPTVAWLTDHFDAVLAVRA